MNTKTPIHNYTYGAWQGENYSSKNSISDITKLVRDYIKQNYKDMKFSVTKRDYNSIVVTLVSSKVSVLETPDIKKFYYNGRILRGHITEEEALGYWNKAIETGRHGVNQYYLEDDYMLTQAGKEMFRDITSFINGYNYDDSDGQIDYFNTNFYLTLSVGTWDKPYTVIA